LCNRFDLWEGSERNSLNLDNHHSQTV
jgi:hypothetical protein